MLTRSDQNQHVDLDALEDHRIDLALACRVLAFRGLAEDILGHVSIRVPGGLLIRCRGRRERGLLFTEPEDIRLVDDRTLAADTPDYAPPNELHIHTQLLRARPDVSVVVHAHPPAVVAADLADLELMPIVGAYNIPATKLAEGGIPSYERGVLVNTPDLGAEVARAMGARPVCVMRGHGLAAVGTSIAQAVNNALHVDSLAQMTLRVAQAGSVAPALPGPDLDLLPDLGSAFNNDQLWRFQIHALDAAGLLGRPGTPLGDALRRGLDEDA